MKINSEKIKYLREKNGLSLKDVAARIGCSEASVSRYENEQVQRVSPSIMLGYSKLFQVPITELYENPQTEWVTAMEEAGLRDPRVAGFIEYLEEQAQKEGDGYTQEEYQLIDAFRKAPDQNKRIVSAILGITDY